MTTPSPPPASLADYARAAAVGVAAAAVMLTTPTILGTGGLWAHPGRDLAQNLTGHLAAQAGPLPWPLLLSPRLDWPAGVSVALTDSNPLMTLLGMAWAHVAHAAPVNLLGAFLALCWLLQPVAAVYALRGIALFHGCPAGRHPPEAVWAVALLSVMVPAFYARFPHVNLLAHFTLLAALGLSARMLARPGGWAQAAALQGVTILIHPYLFVFNAIVLFAPVLARVRSLRTAGRELAGFAAAMAGPALLFRLLSGAFGGGDWGFGYYSMNLLSPVWPQRSGLFGRDLPVIDATGGQYEGFNYAGGGALALVALALRGRRPSLIGWPLAAMLLALTLLALTPRVYAGSWLVLPMGTWPWDQVFGAVRASGRAFWTVGYALVIASVARLSVALPRRWLLPVLAGAVTLQAIDTAQVRHDARTWFARGDQTQPPIPALPAGTALLRVVPACEFPGPLSAMPDLLRLEAVRQGAVLADMRASRPPPSFSCAQADQEATGTPLQPGEARVFIGPATEQAQPGLLGPAATCTQEDGVLLCTRPSTP